MQYSFFSTVKISLCSILACQVSPKTLLLGELQTHMCCFFSVAALRILSLPVAREIAYEMSWSRLY